jgi:methyltransferase family protein
MKWTNKAFIQRVLSNIPIGKSIYYVGQFYFGSLRHYNIEGKMHQGNRLLKALDGSGVAIEGLSAVEIGTGWAPVIPMLFWLFGQKVCNTYDISSLLSPLLVIETAKQLLEHPFAKTPPIKLNNPVAFEERRQLLNKLITTGASGNDILEYCGINYHAPCDASKTGLANQSVDIIYSNTVLEHVPPDELNGLFAESHRILSQNGYILHLIDMSDHFAHSDPTISSINFLQFSEKAFAKYNTCFLYQNRLRVSAWRQIMSDQEFKIIYWQTNIDEKSLKQLPALRIDEAFASLNVDEICTSSVCVLAGKKI